MKLAVEHVLAGYEAFNRGDYDASAALMHPDIVFNRVSDVESTLSGREAVRGNMEPDAYSSQRVEILETVVEGDCVLCRTVFHAKGAGSGIEMSDEAWNLWRIRDGLAIEFRYFNNREEAVAAAGDSARPG